MSLQKLLVLSTLACSLSSPCVTSAADLSVNGRIRADGACSIALGNDGVIDLGNLSTKPPNSGHGMSMTINCQHPTKVGVNVLDNSAGTQPSISFYFGLGNPAIGHYAISDWGLAKADGRSADAISRSKGETTWRRRIFWNVRETTSWDATFQSEPVPVAFKTLTAGLWISVIFNSDFAFTDEMEIAGSATLELVYL